MSETIQKYIDTHEESSQALATTEKLAVVKNPPSEKSITATQAKVEAIADLTHSAYQRAGTLKLTSEQRESLIADFPDEAFKAGAGGNPDLIYIEHPFLRDRFTQVFGMGGWALITRRLWSEHFTIPARRDKPELKGERVYVEAMLIADGVFIGEAIGSMEYYPSNNAQNYGDAVEGAKTAAFRRCAKEFGVGLQAWKKDWCQGWWDRKMRPGKRVYPAPTVTPAAPAAIPEPTEKTKAWFLAEVLKHLNKINADEASFTKFCIDLGWLLPNQSASELELRHVANTPVKLKAFLSCMDQWRDDGTVVQPYDCPIPDPKKKPVEVPRENVDAPEADEPWRSFPMPFGKDAGVLLEDLPKNKLFGWWANYAVETEYNGKPKKPETIAKDQMFRDMLDAAGVHYKFEKKD